MAFLIEHPDGRRYELDNYAAFAATYEREGFVIANPQPRWGVLPVPPSTALRDKLRGGGKKAETTTDDAAVG